MSGKKNNAGFSLIELVVTLAIMGVVVLFSVNIYGNISSADVESAAENFDSMLSILRTRSITKVNEFMLKIEKNSDGEFEICIFENKKQPDAAGNLVDNWVKTDKFNIGDKVSVTCVPKNGATDYNLSATTEFKVICSKSNGKYDSSVCIDDSGAVISGVNDTDLITQVVFKKGSHIERVKLVIPTGRHYVE